MKCNYNTDGIIPPVKCDDYQPKRKQQYTIEGDNFFENGVLYGEIIKETEEWFKVKVVSENKYRNGLIETFVKIYS